MPRTVKKYANRRLYDTEASRHVTLDGIRQLVASGEDVVVIDDTTGEDITRSILLRRSPPSASTATCAPIPPSANTGAS